MNHTKRTAHLTVSSFSKKGNGLATYERPNADPAVVEIPFTVPGDEVIAQLARKRSGTYAGKLLEIIKPSPLRITPKCIHFGVCGGCRLQHISYEEQLKFKEQFIHNCFKDLLQEGVRFSAIVPCDDPWQYRNKMEYSFSQDSSGRRFLGLIMDASHGKVFNLTECHLTHGWFVEALKATKQWWEESGIDAYHMRQDTGSLRTVTMREGMRTGDRLVMLTVSGNPDFALKKSQIESFIAFIRAAVEPIDPNSKLSIYLRIHQICKGTPTNMYEMHLYGAESISEILRIQVDPTKESREIPFLISPSAFFQPNTLQAEKLYSLALRLAELQPTDIVYDLYCGIGSLGLSAADRVKQVIGVELSKESFVDAEANAKMQNCTNVKILSGDVGNVLGQIKEKSLPIPDVIMVDPPRVGLEPKAVQHILELQAKTIVYVSCNPVTQAANVKELIQHGYVMTHIQPVDQFPQTYHVENIVILNKKFPI